MGAAAALGLVWFAILTLIESHLTEGSTATSIAQVKPQAAFVNFLIYGTVIGIGFIGMCAWLLLAAIPSTYRRGALSMVAALGGTALAMVLTAVGHHAFGRSALFALAVIGLAIAIPLGRRASSAE